MLLGLGLLLRFQVLAGRLVHDFHGKAHFASLIEAEQLDLDLVAFLDHVGNFLHSARRQLADVHEAILSPEEIYESAKVRSEEHTSELQSLRHLVCRLLLEKKK